MVNLKVELQAIDFCDVFREAFETCTVLGRFIRNGIVGVHPLDRLAAQPGDVLVRKRYGRGSVLSCAQEFLCVQLLTANSNLGRGIADTHSHNTQQGKGAQ